MNIEDARYIQSLRQRGSWRWVCETCCIERPHILIEMGYKSPQTLGDNQLVGMELCVEANKALGIEFDREGE